ncbi:HDOD domain-containing protein [Chitinilyticum piscinae]|uniref:HDOD domain-containing protein n=1 Tax=Chitinilyticum piscinae TaxID=2866724 RepID=A0A8J7FJ07_9NEIS|nr:HDOD domain-containing protein [Chitinilyticum piscinae]MBE9610218.1 HDOD domain-containing protein [Chitinilyticum piscinae]
MDLAEVFDRAAAKLPSVPKVVQELIASFEKEDTDIDEIARKVSHDQVITAKVLRMANSAKFSAGSSVKTIDDAVVRLGFDALRVLVIASGVSSIQVPNDTFDRQAFWRHSFEVANTCKWLAKYAGLDGNQAYTSGLLANIGELLIHVAFPGQALKIDRLVEGGADRIQLESMELGLDLTQVGEELAKRWHFPADIQRAIRQQRNPAAHTPFEPYAGLIALAELVVHQFTHNSTAEQCAEALPDNMLQLLNINRDKLLANLEQGREICLAVDDLL